MTTDAGEVLHRFTISTWADSRSNRRDRTYTVEAIHAQEAIFEARRLACLAVRQNVSISATVEDVDGRGKPEDCPHTERRMMKGFCLRADGGHDCLECAR